MYTINAIAKQAKVSFDTVRSIIKRKGLEPAQTYYNGSYDVLLYTDDVVNCVVAEAASMRAKRADKKIKTLKKLAGTAAAQTDAEILVTLARLNDKLNSIEQTLQRIEAGLPKFEMGAV